MGGHVCPAADAAVLRPGDAAVGVDEADGTRLVRCVRCDLWLRIDPPPPATARYATLPPVGELDLPLRGEALRDLIVIRAIALERVLHVVVFASLALAAAAVQLKLPAVVGAATDALDGLQQTAANTSRGASNAFVVRELERLTRLRPGALTATIVVAAAYATLEAVEAVFLWRGRRWAEYLTVVATAGMLPFELWELSKGVSALKVVTLAINVAVLVWLVWRKRLFGLRGGAAAAVVVTDWDAILSSPLTPGATARLRRPAG